VILQSSSLLQAHSLCRVNEVRARGVKVGLGTDVAGGYSPSMLSSIRNAVVTSRALRMAELMHPSTSSIAPDSHLLDYKVCSGRRNARKCAEPFIDPRGRG
jgi:cytosine/adenosine deaminase-related metal-dependent hydrolase